MTEKELRNKVVSIMQSWVGLKQSDQSHKVIIDTYNSHRPLARGYAVKYTDAYCAAAVSAAAIKAGLTDIIPTECSCGQMIELFKNKGSWQENDAYRPDAGDIIFYDWDDAGVGDCTGWPEHVGMVEAVNGDDMTIIEGNLNGEVARREIKVNARYIRGYGVPDYVSKTDSGAADHPGADTENTKNGIDVSAYQSFPDWSSVKKSGIDFAILRILNSKGKDSSFEHNWSGCEENGITKGVYRYSYALTISEAEKEAQDVLEVLAGRKPELGVWLDLEWSNQRALGSLRVKEIATAWMQVIRNAGYECNIYCNLDWYKNVCGGLDAQYWIARYATADNGTLNPTLKPNVGESGWQYSSKGKVAGIAGAVDLDIWYGDFPAAPFANPAGKLEIGDVVEFTGTTHYVSSYPGTKGVPCKPGAAKVTAISAGKPHPYHLIHTGQGCTVYGWVDENDIKK